MRHVIFLVSDRTLRLELWQQERTGPAPNLAPEAPGLVLSGIGLLPLKRTALPPILPPFTVPCKVTPQKRLRVHSRIEPQQLVDYNDYIQVSLLVKKRYADHDWHSRYGLYCPVMLGRWFPVFLLSPMGFSALMLRRAGKVESASADGVALGSVT